MSQKRINFKRLIKPLGFFMVLMLTFGICLVSGSIAKAASTDDIPREFIIVNEGYFSPLSAEPVYEGLDRGPLNIPFTFYREDPNSGEYVRFESIRVDYDNGTDRYTVWFSTSATSLSNDSVMVASSVVSDWLTSVSIRVDKKQRIDTPAGYRFLLANYGSNMMSTEYLISGRYEFNDGYISSSFAPNFTGTYDVSGYFESPITFSGAELNDMYALDLNPTYHYYVSTFRNLRITTTDSGDIQTLQFEIYIAATNSWHWFNIFDAENHEISQDYLNTRVLVITGVQYVNFALFSFLDNNGYFGPAIYEPDEGYTPTDLIFAIVDAPIRFIQSLMSFELFGMTFFIVFASIITLTVGLWIIFKKG